jgi:hypothetical protein
MLKVLVLGQGKLGREITYQTRWDSLSRGKDNIDVNNFDEWVHKMNCKHKHLLQRKRRTMEC